MQERYVTAGIALAVGAWIAFMVVACKQPPEPTPKFHEGQIVQTVVGGLRGQVIRTTCWTTEARVEDRACLYRVRFVLKSSSTQTHVVSADGPILQSVISTARGMHQYELRDADD